MSEKRRRARIQGGWAAKASVSSKPQHKAKEQSHSYQFHPTAQIKAKPADIVYSEDGEYILSKTENGVSSIKLFTHFIPQDETKWVFEQLLHEIPWQQESIVVIATRKLQPRLTAWYGDIPYTYSGLTLKPYQFSQALEILKEKMALKMSLNFNSMLANLYRTEKDSVDWHSDDEPSLGVLPVIASLSFGETRTFELRQKPSVGDDYSFSQHVKVPLSSGSLLIMEGATQIDWQHRVPKDYHDRDARINLTFRNICPT